MDELRAYARIVEDLHSVRETQTGQRPRDGVPVDGTPRARRRIARLMVLAFFVYGGWAAWANHHHGFAVSLRSFGVQGLSSATTTLLMGGVIEALRARIGSGPARGMLSAVLATAAAICFHLSLHLVAGTPEIVRTVAPSVVVGFAFASAYARWTAPRRAAAQRTEPPSEAGRLG